MVQPQTGLTFTHIREPHTSFIRFAAVVVVFVVTLVASLPVSSKRRRLELVIQPNRKTRNHYSQLTK